MDDSETKAVFHQHAGMYTLLTLIGTTACVFIPLTIFIMYHFYQNKANLTSKSAMFRSGFLYIFVTLLFYLNYCGRLLNECFGLYKYDYIFVCTTALLYGSHFTLLTYLLFSRLYYVFRDTAHRLNNSTIWLFIAMSVFEILDCVAFVSIVWSTHDNHILIFICYLIGVINIIAITTSITLLYIHKLFQVIKDNPSTQNEKLLQNVTKYTVLAIIWISTAICFWIVPFSAAQLDRHTYLVLYHGFMLLDVSCNLLAYIAGYQFADKAYTKCCSHTHKKCELFFIFLVQKARPTLDELHLSAHIRSFVKTISNQRRNNLEDVMKEVKEDSVDEKERKSSTVSEVSEIVTVSECALEITEETSTHTRDTTVTVSEVQLSSISEIVIHNATNSKVFSEGEIQKQNSDGTIFV